MTLACHLVVVWIFVGHTSALVLEMKKVQKIINSLKYFPFVSEKTEENGSVIIFLLSKTTVRSFDKIL